MRVLMQWDYSYFFPPTAMAGHVTHWGKRPMHFACSVAMSACFGMDVDLTKLPEQDKAICAGAIAAYKQVRDVLAKGDLYRLEDPHDNYRGALDFVSKDRARAATFASVQPLLAYAAANLDDDVSLTALAGKAGLSAFHLQRILSAVIGSV